MKYTNISVTYSRKVNLGNYESVDATCFLSAEIEEQDRLGDVVASLTDTVKMSVFKALESEMDDSVKVVLSKKISGKEVSTKEVVSTVKDSLVNGNNKVINKFSSLLETGEEELEIDIDFNSIPF